MSKPGTPGAYHFAPTMFNLRERLASQWATAKKHLMLVLLFVGILWAVLIIDTALPDHWIDLRSAGIRPRTVSGLLCIFTAPFLHVNVFHLLANTLPLVILGWILVLSGRGLFLQVCAVTALTSGLGAWSLGHGDMIHEGASGVLFGLLGFLLTRGWFARRIVWTVTSACVGLFYLGEVLGLRESQSMRSAEEMVRMMRAAKKTCEDNAVRVDFSVCFERAKACSVQASGDPAAFLACNTP